MVPSKELTVPSGVGELRTAQQANRARVAGRGGEVDDNEEGEVDDVHAVDGGAAARGEAGAAMVK